MSAPYDASEKLPYADSYYTAKVGGAEGHGKALKSLEPWPLRGRIAMIQKPVSSQQIRERAFSNTKPRKLAPDGR